MITIEQSVADTILGNPMGTATINGKDYRIEQPTTATLIMVSALISQLPEIDPDTPREKIIPTLMTAATDCEPLGRVAATLILGAKRIRQKPIITIDTPTTERRWSWRHFRKIDKQVTKQTPVFEIDYVAQEVLENMNPEQLNEFISNALSEAHLADFFVLTTSLRTKSLLSPTREVGETTAYGLPSEAGQSIGK